MSDVVLVEEFQTLINNNRSITIHSSSSKNPSYLKELQHHLTELPQPPERQRIKQQQMGHNEQSVLIIARYQDDIQNRDRAVLGIAPHFRRRQKGGYRELLPGGLYFLHDHLASVVNPDGVQHPP